MHSRDINAGRAVSVYAKDEINCRPVIGPRQISIRKVAADLRAAEIA
jgi:hypothetical protein